MGAGAEGGCLAAFGASSVACLCFSSFDSPSAPSFPCSGQRRVWITYIIQKLTKMGVSDVPRRTGTNGDRANSNTVRRALT